MNDSLAGLEKSELPPNNFMSPPLLYYCFAFQKALGTLTSNGGTPFKNTRKKASNRLNNLVDNKQSVHYGFPNRVLTAKRALTYES